MGVIGAPKPYHRKYTNSPQIAEKIFQKFLYKKSLAPDRKFPLIFFNKTVTEKKS